jgi:formylmethanofuran--tetrahydromethanopterin N-formyltransferase
VKSELSAEVGAVLEIVIDGLTEADVRNAMRAGIHAACKAGSAGGVLRISAGNYGGKLGQFHFRLHDIVK